VRPTRRASAARSLPTGLAPALLDWYSAHARPLPWRRDRDPYRIWVAEVLLQQTRVAQAAPYFERFMVAFPSVTELAAAPERTVLKVWEGAGYYARARNLSAAARAIVDRWNGRLPRDVGELATLPGVGPYIARAIASLAYGTPSVALEANGLRVAARWTCEAGDPRDPPIRRRLAAALEDILPGAAPGRFNEAVMELGETICLPRAPRCGVCPVRRYCRARRELADPGSIPPRRRRVPRPHVRGAIVVLWDGPRRLVQRRPSSGLLGGLYEFPGGKIERGERPIAAARRELLEETGIRAPPLQFRGVVRHAYSHFSVELHVFEGRIRGHRTTGSSARRWVTVRELGRLPIPKATEKVLRLLAAEPKGRALA
jgi:A/G-specific adenine glycosylase